MYDNSLNSYGPMITLPKFTIAISVGDNQTSTNNSTPPCYSKNIRYSPIIRGWIVGRLVAQYLTRPKLNICILEEYTSSGGAFRKKGLRTSDSIFDQYLTQYSTGYWTRGWVTRSRSIKFTIQLRLDLGHEHLVFASTTNLELAPRFTEIWWWLFEFL